MAKSIIHVILERGMIDLLAHVRFNRKFLQSNQRKKDGKVFTYGSFVDEARVISSVVCKQAFKQGNICMLQNKQRKHLSSYLRSSSKPKNRHYKHPKNTHQQRLLYVRISPACIKYSSIALCWK